MKSSKTADQNKANNEFNYKLSSPDNGVRQEDLQELSPIILSSSQSVFYIAQDRKFLVVTSQFIQLTGLSRDELLGINPLDIVHPEDRATVRDNAEKMLKGQRSEPYEFRFLDNKGNIKYALETVTSIVFKEKPAILGNWIDLTERRLMEEELRISEERYRNLFDNLNDAAFLADMYSGIIVETNQQGAALLGRSRNEIIGMHQSQLHPPDKAENYKKLFNEHAAQGTVFNEDGEVIRKDGKIIPVTINTSTLTIHGQYYILGMFHDITRRKKIEEALQESERFNSRLLTNAPNPITVINPDTSLKYVNPAFEKLTGFTSAEVVGLKPPYPWWPDESRTEFASILMQDMSRDSNLVEKQLQKKNGERFWTEFNVVSVNYNGKLEYLLLNWVDITARKQAEIALRESEEKFSKAFYSSPNTMAITTVKGGKFIEINDSHTRLTGYTREETIGHTAVELGLWAKAEDRARMLNILKEQGRVENEEFIFRMKTGELHNWLFSAEPITIGGEPCLISMTIDITGQRRMEQALRESEEKFSKAFHAIPEAVSIATIKDGIFLDVNESFLKHNWHTREEVIGHNAKELNIWANPDDRYRMKKLMDESGHFGNEEFIFLSKSGELRTVLLSAEPINVGGQPCMLSIGTEITGRKKMEQALRESEEKFSIAFRSSPEIIAVSNMKTGIYIEVNDSFVRTTGYSREELIGHPVNEINMFVNQQDTDKMTRLMQEKGQIRNEEFSFRMKSGEIRQWLCSSETITIGGDPCSIAVAADITERKKMEDELRQHKDHLEELISTRTIELETLNKKLEQELDERGHIEDELRDAIKRADAANRAKSEFLARMSHEIRTPIHGVMGTLDLLRDTQLAKEQQQYVNMSKASAETLLNVINDILDFSKIEAGKLEVEFKEFEIHTILEDTLEALAVSAHRKGLEVILQISDGVPKTLLGDAGHLRQIFINLLGNAIKFTAQGEIILRAEVEGSDGKNIELHFSVRDTGIGIPKEKQEILFQPFEQVDGSSQRKYGGTGLGLSICKQLVTLMGGRIWFKSWPGEGSVFHFTVKFGKSSVSEPPDSDLVISPELRGTSILLADDNVTYRSILRNLLNEWGFKVTEAESGRSAIKELEDAAGTSRSYRVILLDKEMPTMNGFATAGQILQNPVQNCTVIMMLPSDNISDDFARCQELGISHYLLKPVKKSELLKIILKALGQEKTVNETGDEAIAEHSGADTPHLNILVAEDNATSQLIAKKTLEKSGHTVQIAGTGIEAIRMLKEGKFDLILMDVEMPEMSGIEATRVIRKTENGSSQHIPIIAMTAYAMKEDRQRCLDAGMDTYISKPVNLDELHKIIRGLSLKKESESSVVDIEAALKFVGGDKEILKEVVRVFVEDDYPEQLKHLKDGINQHNADTIKAAAHSIKGAVRSLGGITLGNTAFRLEEMGRNQNLDGAEAALQELELEIIQFTEYYARYNEPKVK